MALPETSLLPLDDWNKGSSLWIRNGGLRSCALAAGLLCLAAFNHEQPVPQIHQLEIADCDDVDFGPDEDLFLACHSPQDRLPINVLGSKAVPDEMDAYVLRLNPHTGNLVFATRFGGNSFDAALRIKVDKQGYAYATGLTRSPDFPVTRDAAQQSLGGKSDAFLVKIAPGGEIVYATLIGGTGEDLGNALDLDKSGNVYVGGTTSSGDFPGQSTKRLTTEDDAFVCRIESVKHGISCRVFGGNKSEMLTGIVLDRAEGLYATGWTKSANFPTKHSLQKVLGGRSDSFLTRLALPSLEITHSTFFGGAGEDTGWGIAVDRTGNPFVAGTTDSTNLPGTTGSYQSRNHGKKDIFLASIHIRRHRRVRTTYLGGSKDDESAYEGGDIKVDRNGNVWVAGITYSEDLPTRNASQAQFGGGNGDGFVVVFDPNLKRLCFGSYFGDSGRNLLEGLAISPSGLVALTGVSFSEAPSAFCIPIGQSNLYAGTNLFLVQTEDVCSR